MDSKVRDNPEMHRFERQIHAGVLAAAYYEVDGERPVFVHVEVPEFEGRALVPPSSKASSIISGKEAKRP
ncbi:MULTISPECIES: hypothetical protein [unclassified Rhizobium]|uniref:hypothetical protein n=1 Tax=unclassified Rhizobium TaxID=2613769 RepID=UPI0017CCB033|nr:MULTISPECIES: hypothetical protein [unclassified Rhizobium]MBB3399414.1 hypothetical protein [Rhizobium sp. BK060]MBB4169740.1 hypothetical protein [Rhizobium sp. BK538]